MKPLIVLIGSFLIAVLAIRIIYHQFDFSLAGRIGMSVMLLFTSLGHFLFAKGMAMMIPDLIPFKSALVFLTGIFEILAAIFLLNPGTRIFTAWLLILFFIIILPANINSAIKKINHEKGTTDGKGIKYLLFRIPLQIVFIAWIYLCSLR